MTLMFFVQMSCVMHIFATYQFNSMLLSDNLNNLVNSYYQTLSTIATFLEMA